MHLSGFQKRRKQKEKDVQQMDEVSKLQKIDNIFKVAAVVPPAPPPPPAAAAAVYPATHPPSAAAAAVPPASPPPPAAAAAVPPATPPPPAVAAAVGLKNFYYSNDIGLWGDDVSENLRSFWIEHGSKECQHFNEKEINFEKSAVLVTGKSDKETYYRHCSKSYFFHVHRLTEERIERKWLCYSPATGCVYCFACKLLSPSPSVFTTGFKDWKHGEQRISSHEHGEQHRTAMMCLATRHKTSDLGRVDGALLAQYEEKCNYWRKLLTRIVSVIRFLCERGLPFRGDNELVGSTSNGNYLGILELISEYDTFLAEHIRLHGNKGRGHTSYLSSTICEEFIQIMGKKVLSVIVEEAKLCKYYSISVDSTPDVSHVDQLTFIIRYVLPTGPVERFLRFLPIFRHTGAHMTEIALDFLKDNNIDIQDCRGQSYDNASNMSGKYNGMQQLVLEQCKYADFVPCSAHSLNLVGTHAAECCGIAVSFFDFVQRLYTFFSASTFRWQILCKKLNPLNLVVVKMLSGTRWSTRADAVKALFEGYVPIEEALHLLSGDNEQTSECRVDANGLLKKMRQLETCIMIEFWHTVLLQFNKTSLSLQKVGLTLNTMINLLESLVVYVESQRGEFHVFEARGIARCGNDQFKDSQQRVRARNRRFDDGNAEDTVLSARDVFRTQGVLSIIDHLQSSLHKRIAAYNGVNRKFGFLSKLTTISPSLIRESAEQLILAYPDDLENDLSDELVQFAALLKIQKTDVKQEVSIEIQQYLLLKDCDLVQTFPNVDIALRIYLCMMASNCSGERSFSRLKRIKSELRSTMSQDRLNFLSIMCIETDVLNCINYTDVIDNFARCKLRKRPM
jgi:hypothetical protein